MKGQCTLPGHAQRCTSIIAAGFQMSLLTRQPHRMPYCCYLTCSNPIISSVIQGAASKFCVSDVLLRSLPWIQKAMVKIIFWCNYAEDLHCLKIHSICTCVFFPLRRLLIVLMNISDAHLKAFGCFKRKYVFLCVFVLKQAKEVTFKNRTLISLQKCNYCNYCNYILM